MPSLVHYSVQGAAARIVLDSPHNKNALSTALVHQLQQGLSDAAEESGVRAVVLTHTGTTFCAGADLAAATSGKQDADPADVAVDRAHEMTHLLRAILELPVPVIAAVNGQERAGWIGLIGACDNVVAGPATTFALTEARIGVAPSIISLTLLPKMNPRAAARYFVTGERFDSHEAASIGLITQAADSADDMAAAVTALIENIAKGSPQGLAASKALTTASILADFDRHADELAKQSAELFVSEEAREGMMAFLQKRLPNWVAAAQS
ncbi:MAG: enoyl-CoA hydratase [Mycobacterium sp.]|nr:enoyl-CoA hydratase [Mycobacterium sp.]